MGTFEGYGAGATGGSTSQVVSNLNDSGTGSLRAALATSTPSITFSVEGVIWVESTLSVPSNCTIDGSTAPGNGITIATKPGSMGNPWHALRLNGVSNVILTQFRVRPFAATTHNNNGDGITIEGGCDTIMIDQLSVSWWVDGAIDIVGSTNVTVQWCYLYQGLREPYPGLEVPIGLGVTPSTTSGNVSIHHNLFAHNASRNPRVNCTGGPVEVINNVVCNPANDPMAVAGTSQADVVKNYYIKGNSSLFNWLINSVSTATIYHNSSNVCQNCTGFTQVDPADSPTISGTRLASPTTPVTEQTADSTLRDNILANAGCTSPERDTFDKQVKDQVDLLVGDLISFPETEIGGVCEIPSEYK